METVVGGVVDFGLSIIDFDVCDINKRINVALL